MNLQRVSTPLKLLLVLGALYLFLVGIGGMGAAFKLIGKGQASEYLQLSAPPLVSLFIGILATTLVQSSSTTTSTVVALVAAGTVSLESAAFMVMGANVGTTVTNTLVSLGHITRSEEYKRAFAAATVHDFFNVLVLLVLFPLEVFTGLLTRLAEGATSTFEGAGGISLSSPVKVVTKPLVDALKSGFAELPGGGALMAIASLLLMFGMLIMLVKTLRSLAVERLESFFDRLIFRTAPRALAFGLAFTIVVQSSSVTTSLAIPLAGAGLVTVRQIFPYTMGANIGTTGTTLLAALGAYAAAGADGEAIARHGLVLAFFHVLFNVLGVAMMWRFRELPVAIAIRFSELSMRNRFIPLVYIVGTFYILPALVILIWGAL